ncbi:MAG TPA: ribosomal-processing cysteine protease Prp [Candidatus Enterenecus stercoripullorum]|nr:ribosomal-processing cysteine protease Prp [Candidatus Enterenecus stercoripullorum]
MTTVTFHSAEDRLDGFTVEGHSGYAQAGNDIVCAAISAAVGLVECTVNEVLGLAAPVKMRQQEGFLSLKLPGGLGNTNEVTCQTLLTGLMVYLESLSEEYPEHLAVRLDDDDEEA